MYFYNHDPDPVNHDLDVVGDDDNEDDDNDGDTHDHAHDDNQYSGDDHHQDLAVNALTLQPPSPLPNKSYIIFIQKRESFVYHWSQIQEKQCKSGLRYISRWIKTKISGQNIAKIGLNFRDSTSSI